MNAAAALPADDTSADLIAGNVKVIKNANRRSDSLYFINPDDIRIIDGYNVRVATDGYNEHVRSIASSMLAEGFHQDSPLSVYVAKVNGEDVVALIRGHTRLKALQLANAEGASIKEVPVIFKPKSISPQELALDLITSNNGRSLTPYESAVVIKRLLNLGMEPGEIAAKAGISLPHVDTLTLLASAPPRLALLVANEEVSASLAVDLIRKHGPVDAQRRAIDAVERAKQAGHKQATVRNLPESDFKRTLTKAAPKLFEATTAIAADPGYAGLSAQTRALIDELLSGLKKPEADAQAAA